MNDVKPGMNMNVCGTFTSLLNTQGPGFFALSGMGLGLGPGLEDMGFGLGRAVWPFPGVGIGEGGHTGSGAGPGSIMGNSWQMQSGEDCFTLSDVAISTTGVGNGMK